MCFLQLSLSSSSLQNLLGPFDPPGIVEFLSHLLGDLEALASTRSYILFAYLSTRGWHALDSWVRALKNGKKTIVTALSWTNMLVVWSYHATYSYSLKCWNYESPKAKMNYKLISLKRLHMPPCIRYVFNQGYSQGLRTKVMHTHAFKVEDVWVVRTLLAHPWANSAE